MRVILSKREILESKHGSPMQVGANLLKFMVRDLLATCSALPLFC